MTNLSVTANLDWLVFVPGVGQVSRLSERKLPPGEHKEMIPPLRKENMQRKLFCCYSPAKPVDLEDSAQHLSVHACREDPVDGRAAVVGLRRQTCKTYMCNQGNAFKPLNHSSTGRFWKRG